MPSTGCSAGVHTGISVCLTIVRWVAVRIRGIGMEVAAVRYHDWLLAGTRVCCRRCRRTDVGMPCQRQQAPEDGLRIGVIAIGVSQSKFAEALDDILMGICTVCQKSSLYDMILHSYCTDKKVLSRKYCRQVGSRLWAAALSSRRLNAVIPC